MKLKQAKDMKCKIIRDNVHGYVNIPEIIFDEIIDTPVFQRLRRIEQTSMRALYPCAHHDRFIHSIGVYYLGCKAINGLLRNLSSYNLEIDESFWETYRLLFSLACLLHDCAHAPFSHSFEYAYIDQNNDADVKEKKERLLDSMLFNSALMNKRSKKYKRFVDSTKLDVEKYFSKKISPHEMASAIIVSEYFKNPIKNVIKAILNLEVDDYTIMEFIQFIQRAIMGLDYTFDDDSKNVNIYTDKEYRRRNFKNCLIHLLNFKSFDVDKLDYIVRDSFQSGTDNMSVDIERILGALAIVEIHIFKDFVNIEELDLYNSIYFSDCQNGSLGSVPETLSECSLKLKGVKLSGDFIGSIKIRGIDSNLNRETGQGLSSGLHIFKKVEHIDAHIIDGEMKGNYIGTVEIYTRGNEENSIDGTLYSKLSGKIKGTIVGSLKKPIKGDTILEIGYKKNALNIIEDTLIARNRLYLWIYAHHTVTYNDYALRRAVLTAILGNSFNSLAPLERIKEADNLLRRKININNLIDQESENYLVEDGDLLKSIKESFSTHGSDNNEYELEWLTRKHKYAVWKNYAEYNMYFSNLNDEERIYLWELLFNEYAKINDKNFINVKEATSFEYNHSILKSFSVVFPENDCEYVWIKPAGIKLEEMNANHTYILLADKTVKRLKDVLIQVKTTEQYADDNFFYLYTSVELSYDEKLLLISSLKQKVRNK